jgi:branched-chain amino acid transport system ATP-binding protein
MAALILETRGLTKRYGGLDAVRDVDLALTRGGVTALIGPNGAGKSTLVGLITGRIQATAGRVLFEGRDVGHLPAHRRIRLGMAYTFQITSIFPGLSAYENAALAARHGGGPGAAEAALAQVGLAPLSDRRAGDLSYGDQRLLEIAMGLAQDPTLFILDEPTQGLAQAERDAFVGLVRDLSRDATVLLIEHDMEVVMAAADRLVVMDQGAVLASGPPEAVRGDPAVQAAYLGTGDA